MYCDECKSRPATIHYESIINGVKTTKDLCLECSGKVQTDMGSTISLSNFFSNFFFPMREQITQEQKCENCGMSTAEFRSNGLLGCRQCYSSLSDAVYPFVRQIQKGDRHVGRIPPNIPLNTPDNTTPKDRKLEKLRLALNAAIKKENFELAATLRDEIKIYSNSKALENKISQDDSDEQ